MTNDDKFLFNISDTVFDRCANVGFLQLSKPEQVFYCEWSLEGEINNGGFDQFYFNSSGDYAIETVAALEAIGASHTADIVRQANAVFGASGPSHDWSERQNQLDALPDSAEDTFNTLDQQFFEYKDKLGDLLKSYVAANEEEFRTP